MKTSYCESNRLTIAIYKPRINIIQAIVCDYLGVDIKTSQAHTRKRNAIIARFRVHYLCRQFMPNCPMDIIGLLTGSGKAWDHSSVSRNSRELEKEITLKNRKGELVYPDLVIEINELKKLIADEFKKVRSNPSEKPVLNRCPTCGKLMKVKL
jgi:chromosomal replication initiation ATPase DnaA